MSVFSVAGLLFNVLLMMLIHRVRVSVEVKQLVRSLFPADNGYRLIPSPALHVRTDRSSHLTGVSLLATGILPGFIQFKENHILDDCSEQQLFRVFWIQHGFVSKQTVVRASHSFLDSELSRLLSDRFPLRVQMAGSEQVSFSSFA